VRLDGEEAAVREEVAVRRPFAALRRFRREGAGELPRVLLVAPLSGHFATQLRETVSALLPEFEVLVTDWADARDVPLAAGRFDLGDNVACVRDFIAACGPGAHVVGVCQGGSAALAAAALQAAAGDRATPRTLTIMGSPIDPRVGPSPMSRLARAHSLDWFERMMTATVPTPYAGHGRRVHPGFLQLASLLAMQFERVSRSHVEMFLDALDRRDGSPAHRFCDEFLAVMDLTAEYYLDTVQSVFKEHALVSGTLRVHGARVEPIALRETALLTVEAGADSVTGAGQCHAAHALCTGIPDDRRDRCDIAGADHMDLFVGPHLRRDVLPRLRAFLRAHR
jgi:poly(3-hydroxybutyrate) depolymerase